MLAPAEIEELAAHFGDGAEPRFESKERAANAHLLPSRVPMTGNARWPFCGPGVKARRPTTATGAGAPACAQGGSAPRRAIQVFGREARERSSTLTLHVLEFPQGEHNRAHPAGGSQEGHRDLVGFETCEAREGTGNVCFSYHLSCLGIWLASMGTRAAEEQWDGEVQREIHRPEAEAEGYRCDLPGCGSLLFDPPFTGRGEGV